MLIWIDGKAPADAIRGLSQYGEVVRFDSGGMGYPPIGRHPDCFFCRVLDTWVVSPGLPERYYSLLVKHGIRWTLGLRPTGAQYPASAAYNALSAHGLFVHRADITDPILLEHASGQTLISVSQGYTRCNAVALPGGGFITSDGGIYAALLAQGRQALLVNPGGIILPGFPNGFFGGCCGTWGGRLFINGALKGFADGAAVRSFAAASALDTLELHSGPLYDGGGILFME